MGLWTGVSLYAVDLGTMTVMPAVVGEDKAMRAMRELHLGYSWYINTTAAVLIAAGLAIFVVRLTGYIKDVQVARDRFEGFANSASDWLWETDRNGRIVWQSASGQQTDGLSFNKVYNKTREQIAGPEMSDEDWEPYREAIAAHAAFKNFDCRYIDADGNRRFVVLDGEALFDDSGAYAGHRGVARDVTESVVANESLRESRERLLQATSLAGLGYFIWDVASDRCEYCSEEYTAIHGMSVERYIERAAQIDGEFTLVHVEDRERVHRQFQRLRQGQKIDFECRLSHPDGETRYVREIAVPIFGPNGAVVRELGTIIDLTRNKMIENELRENETRYRDAARIASLGHWAYDEVEDRLTYCSEELARIHGVTREEHLAQVSTTGGDIGRVHHDDRETYGKTIRAAQRDATTFNVEYRIIRPDGEVRYLREMGEPVLNDEGKLVKSRGTVQDITDLKRVEALLIAAKTEAEAANAAKSEFLAAMSHELRTPLNAISGFSEMILNQVFGEIGNEKYREYAEHIFVSGKHLQSIVNDILDLSKIEAGQMVLEPKRFSLASAIEDAVRLIGFRGDRDASAVRADVSEDAKDIYADVRSFRQIMINLLSNADKYTPTDGRIAIEASVEPDRSVRIDIIDEGVGIPEEDLPRILEPFSQSRETAELSHDGTGLGLSLSSRLMELHGGRLSVRSRIGHGTIVTLIFPPEPSDGETSN